ncbi:hypothetical protein EMEDMD4_380042 [Sinorhizobium medicae]|uniref:Uncharacterized protein n=1 Tax=Sinorhizobium medicae TaxID=110321 RepID=A0A508WXR8_9HYPH|nr:hypothetical protein EMEDMD4_380042 [Sinorhizobium medicae]
MTMFLGRAGLKNMNVIESRS